MGAASVVGLTGRSRKSTPTAETGAGIDRQGLHHLLRGRVQQLVGLPDQHLDHLVLGQVAGAVQQVARGQGVIAVQDRLDRLQRPREPAGVLAQPVEQLLGGIAQPEAAVVVQLPQHDLGVRGAQALLQPQLTLPGGLDLQQRGRRHPGGGDHRDRVRGRGQHRAQRLVQRRLGQGFPLGVHHRFQVVQQHHHRLPGREGLQHGQHHLRRSCGAGPGTGAAAAAPPRPAAAAAGPRPGSGTPPGARRCGSGTRSRPP